MENESQSGTENDSKQPGGSTIMNDRTSGRQGAGVRQQDQSGSGNSQQGGTQGSDEDSDDAKESTTNQI